MDDKGKDTETILNFSKFKIIHNETLMLIDCGMYGWGFFNFGIAQRIQEIPWNFGKV